MLQIQRFVCNPFQENCYVVSDETNEAVIIDCGAFDEAERKAIVRYIGEKNLNPVHLLVTHAHIDHNFGNNTLYEQYGLQPEMSSQDEVLYQRLKEQAIRLCGIEIDYDFPAPGRMLSENDTIRFGNHQLTIIPTPGHSKGSIFFYCKEEQLAFSGDTLFRMSIGRTDFDFGSFDEIMESMQLLKQVLPGNTTILPGHGPATTMQEELRSNPYLR